MKACSYSHLANHVLRREMVASLAREHGSLAEFLGCLAEFDARKLYAAEGYPSVYAFCLGELHLSEDAAYKRIRVARAARQFPAIYAAITGGRLNLSGVVLLAPYLRPGMADELLAAAAHKSNFGIQELLARHFPRPDLPTRMEPVLTVPAVPLACDQESQLAVRPVGTGAEPGISQTYEAGAPHARLTPLSPERYGVQFTMRGSTRDLLREVQDLLGHTVPSGDLDLVLALALEALREKLEHAKHAAVSQRRKSPSNRAPKDRHVSSEIKRQVRQRDGKQCTYVSDKGNRCEARRDLELDHVQPFARGGKSTVANLRLRCRTHNQLEAERVYGEQYMRNRRQAGLRGHVPREDVAGRSQRKPSLDCS